MKTILFLIYLLILLNPFLYADHPKSFSEDINYDIRYDDLEGENKVSFSEYLKIVKAEYEQEHIDQKIKQEIEDEKELQEEYLEDEKRVLKEVVGDLHRTKIFFAEFNPVTLDAIKKFRESGVLLEISLTLFQVKSDLKKAGFNDDESMRLITGTMKFMTSAVDKIKN